jgi:signal transduction histidine kinase
MTLLVPCLITGIATACVMGVVGWIALRKYARRIDTLETERNQLQAQVAQLAELKDQFLSNVSHEFRSPLASVKGFLDLICRQGDNFTPKQKEYLLAMKEGTERLRLFVDNVIDMTKIQGGVMEYNVELVDVQEVAEKTLASLENHFKPCQIKADLQMSTRFCAWADPELLKKIFFQLLTNAINATPDGGRITLWAKDNGENVMMGVTDTGVGIPAEKESQLFGKFEQAKIHNPQVRKSHGTGLGLAIVQRLVETQGGKIWVERTSPGGSIIAFTLPKPKRGQQTNTPDHASVRRAA